MVKFDINKFVANKGRPQPDLPHHIKPGEERMTPPKPPCAHLGGPTGEKRLCPTCSGSVLVKLMACSVHGACTTARRVQGVACCVGCVDHKPL